eukprot:528695-Amphidinium_carterae.1
MDRSDRKQVLSQPGSNGLWFIAATIVFIVPLRIRQIEKLSTTSTFDSEACDVFVLDRLKSTAMRQPRLQYAAVCATLVRDFSRMSESEKSCAGKAKQKRDIWRHRDNLASMTPRCQPVA